MSETGRGDGSIDWDGLEMAVRHASEAIRMTPRHVPARIEVARLALEAAVAAANRAGGRPEVVAALEAVTANVRAAGQNLVHADRFIRTAQDRLTALRNGTSAAPAKATPWSLA